MRVLNSFNDESVEFIFDMFSDTTCVAISFIVSVFAP